MRKKNISVRDLATECEVAIGTVSRVINNKPGVREDLKERVLEAIRKHKYNPYHNVPLISKIRTRTLKVVMPYYDSEIFLNGFYSKGFEGIRREALKKGFDLTLTGENLFSEEEFRTHEEGKLPNSSEGVIFFCPHKDWDHKIRQVQQWGIPTALINRDTECEDVIVVKEKSRAGNIQLMLEHLKKLGHKTLGCITPLPGKIIKNVENFIAAMEMIDLPYDPSLVILSHEMDQKLEELKNKNRLPDALLGLGDHLAIGTLKRLQKMGLNVPEDIAVVGYSNIDLGRYTTPELTTIDSHIDKMGAFAAKLLMEKIEGSEFGEMEIEFEGDLVVRESCGAKEKRSKNVD